MAGTDSALPVLYSFRRCPYAMRARMAIKAAAQRCELREVVLRDKPAEMISASPKATVPVLVLPDGTVLEESLDIMEWALARNDPADWKSANSAKGNTSRDEISALIGVVDGPFKRHLDRYKYPSRYGKENDGAGVDPLEHRAAGMRALGEFEQRLARHAFLLGASRTLADVATAPFVRQFAMTDLAWFNAQPVPGLQRWLNTFLEWDGFTSVMTKYPQWRNGDALTVFP